MGTRRRGARGVAASWLGVALAAALQASNAAAAQAVPTSSAAVAPSGVASAAAAPAAPAATAAAASAAASASEAPVYRTRVPPPVVLHYLMRRGILQGSGELRWQRSGGRYSLQLDGSIAGFRILRQTSEGGFDAAGLAPRRFSDQRLRGEVLVADFDRDAGRISFSAYPQQLPLAPGTQDRLSWMIQLAAILAADPARLVAGAQIALPVVGARADPAVWTLRYVGPEDVETGAGTVRAARLERVGSGNGENAVDVWVDPKQDYLPIRATLHPNDSSSALELTLQDLVFER